MRKPALIIPALLSGLAVMATPALAEPRPSGEAQLAKTLAGRVAGKPVDCISLNDTRDMVVIDRTAIVYGSGSVLYVNRPRDPASLDSDKIIVTKPTGDQLCSVDIVTLRDHTQFMFAGTVALGQFVPYTRPPKPPASGGN